MALEKEMQTYQRELERLLPNEGKYVLIHGDDVAGLYDTYADALAAGYEKYHLDPFLVKRIQVVEQIQSFTRHLIACHT